jgi:hypothetical protein
MKKTFIGKSLAGIGPELVKQWQPMKAGSYPNIILFDYQNSRAGVRPKGNLDGFDGYLQIDGCMAHARSYFIDAKKAP